MKANESAGFDVKGSLEKSIEGYANTMDNEQVIKIPVNKICPNRFQPRKFIDENYLKELCASILEKGLIQPITVRKNSDPDSSCPYELMAGEMRWRATQLAGMDRIKAIIVDIDDIDSETNALIENLIRKDLTFWETMLAFASLRQKLDTPEAVSKNTGKTQRTVESYLRFHKKIFAHEQIAALFETQAKDLDYTTAETFYSVADRIHALQKKDKREFERILKKMEKKGIKDTVKSFAEKQKKSAETAKTETADAMLRETDKELVLHIRIKKDGPVNADYAGEAKQSILVFMNKLDQLANGQTEEQ